MLLFGRGSLLLADPPPVAWMVVHDAKCEKEWLPKAAKMGDAEAQYRLGCCFLEGEVSMRPRAFADPPPVG